MNELSVGFLDLEKSMTTLLLNAPFYYAFEINSLPLSTWFLWGAVFSINFTCFKNSPTSSPFRLRQISIAKHFLE
jgi:hypothetical protein